MKWYFYILTLLLLISCQKKEDQPISKNSVVVGESDENMHEYNLNDCSDLLNSCKHIGHQSLIL